MDKKDLTENNEQLTAQKAAAKDSISQEPKPKLASGHRSCAGCPMGIIVRTVLNASEDPVVVSSATGCLEVTTTIYPETSWNVPFIHSAFENASATISGVETAHKALLKKKERMKRNLSAKGLQDKLGYEFSDKINFIAFGGDGGTYDIGLQSLSGALERGHDFLYVCYDNQGYMNTGGQRSSATPKGASTTTTPAGDVSQGKVQKRKNLMEIVAAHNIAYAATASVGNLPDLKLKVKKALAVKGPKFIDVLSPCPTVWKFLPAQVMAVAKLAVETKFWPLYEIENGQRRFTYEPKEFVPIEKFLKTQKRFAHLFKDPQGEKIIQEIQRQIEVEWARLG